MRCSFSTEARFACHQVRRRTCEQLRACGHTPEQLPERNLCTYTGSAVRCLFSTAMMPSLARTTSAVCSLPGAHEHTRSVVCLCWRRGVMRTCTGAGVCWAFLHARHAVSSHVPTTQPSRARTSPGARRRTRTQEQLRAASPPMRPSTARTSPGAHPVRTYASDCAPPLQRRMHARRSSRARLLLHDSAANMTRRPQDG